MAAGDIRLVQITDCHLLEGDGERLKDVDTAATLAAVVGRVRAEAPDAVLMTGDLSQDGSAASYRRARELLSGIGAPVYCLPGNHDDRATLAAEVAGDGIAVTRALDHGGWRIVFLDSTVDGEDDGHLPEAELAALDDALAARPETHVLVCLHHQPVAVGGAWGDVVSLANPGDLFAVLERHDHTRGVLWGHIHQPFEAARGALRLIGSPSTCFQFAPGADGGLAIGPEPPAYRRIVLRADGGIDSAVQWLGAACHD